jgi:hypothetical protein
MAVRVDWVKWGTFVALAAAVVALIGVLVVHRDQRARAYIAIVPVGWTIKPGGVEQRAGFFGTVYYNITVTGSTPARNVLLRETCVSPIPINTEIKAPKLGWQLGDLPPGTFERTCGIDIKDDDPDDARIVGVVSYEDEAGRHSVAFCFDGAEPNVIVVGKKYPDLGPCDASGSSSSQ